MDINNNKPFLTLKDYSVTGDTFDLFYDEITDMLITYPQPQPQELHKYYKNDDYISHTDSKKSLFEIAYHLVKYFALKRKVSLISSFQKEKGHLLDIGAGTGEFLLSAKQKGWKTTGIELNTDARNIALAKGINFVGTTDVLENHSYDVITLWHVLEHLPNLDYQITELRRLLKPNGRIIVAVPNYKSYDACYYGKYWAAFDAPIHFWHFSKKSIQILFKSNHMEIEDIFPMKFDSFYVSLLSEKYKTGKMNFFQAFYIGLKSNFKAIKSTEYSSLLYIIKSST